MGIGRIDPLALPLGGTILMEPATFGETVPANPEPFPRAMIKADKRWREIGWPIEGLTSENRDTL
jgi:hypothetical protein